MSTTATVGLIGAGAMGARVGGSLVSSGARVVSVLSDRTPASQQRAIDEGITPVADLAAVLAESSIVLSVVPPGVASEVAGELVVAAKGLADGNTAFVDCNAISPGRAREIAGVIETAGLTYVDGGLIGSPPAPDRPTALYLSGAGGDAVADALRNPELRVEWLGPQSAAASALKMAYAAWTKGVNALVLSIRAFARAEGVEEALVDEWERSQPAALAVAGRAPATAGKAWRWIGEMDEIGVSLDDAGLPDGAFRSAAEVYRRLHAYKDADASPTLDEMIDCLLYLPPITPGT